MLKLETTAMEIKINDIARVCHEANKAYCISLCDYSQPSWEDAPQWMRDSAKDGVRNILENPDTTPQMSHINWMTHKLNNGWVYGPNKDPKAKTHPCMVPYHELPQEQRTKDAIFTAIVRVMM